MSKIELVMNIDNAINKMKELSSEAITDKEYYRGYIDALKEVLKSLNN